MLKHNDPRQAVAQLAQLAQQREAAVRSTAVISQPRPCVASTSRSTRARMSPSLESPAGDTIRAPSRSRPAKSTWMTIVGGDSKAATAVRTSTPRPQPTKREAVPPTRTAHRVQTPQSKQMVPVPLVTLPSRSASVTRQQPPQMDQQQQLQRRSQQQQRHERAPVQQKQQHHPPLRQQERTWHDQALQQRDQALWKQEQHRKEMELARRGQLPWQHEQQQPQLQSRRPPAPQPTHHQHQSTHHQQLQQFTDELMEPEQVEPDQFVVMDVDNDPAAVEPEPEPEPEYEPEPEVLADDESEPEDDISAASPFPIPHRMPVLTSNLKSEAARHLMRLQQFIGRSDRLRNEQDPEIFALERKLTETKIAVAKVQSSLLSVAAPLPTIAPSTRNEAEINIADYARFMQAKQQGLLQDPDGCSDEIVPLSTNLLATNPVARLQASVAKVDEHAEASTNLSTLEDALVQQKMDAFDAAKWEATETAIQLESLTIEHEQLVNSDETKQPARLRKLTVEQEIDLNEVKLLKDQNKKAGLENFQISRSIESIQRQIKVSKDAITAKVEESKSRIATVRAKVQRPKEIEAQIPIRRQELVQVRKAVAQELSKAHEVKAREQAEQIRLEKENDPDRSDDSEVDSLSGTSPVAIQSRGRAQLHISKIKSTKPKPRPKPRSKPKAKSRPRRVMTPPSSASPTTPPLPSPSPPPTQRKRPSSNKKSEDKAADRMTRPRTGQGEEVSTPMTSAARQQQAAALTGQHHGLLKQDFVLGNTVAQNKVRADRHAIESGVTIEPMEEVDEERDGGDEEMKHTDGDEDESMNPPRELDHAYTAQQSRSKPRRAKSSVASSRSSSSDRERGDWQRDRHGPSHSESVPATYQGQPIPALTFALLPNQFQPSLATTARLQAMQAAGLKSGTLIPAGPIGRQL